MKSIVVILVGLSISASLSLAARGAELQFGEANVLGNLQADQITEASGMAVSSLTPNVFWTHNDGSRKDIYAVRFDGALLATYNLGKNPTDVEDIATGPGPEAGARYIYVGDVGSNAASRDTVRLYRVREPAVDTTRADNPLKADFSGVDTLRLHYPDGTYNAEGIMIDPIAREVFVVTKQASEARVYRAAMANLADGETTELQFVISLPFVTASSAAISPDGSLAIIRREDFAVGWQRNPGESMADVLARPWTQVPVVTPAGGEPNGEAISFLPDSSGYLTVSEGVNATVFQFLRKAACSEGPKFTAWPASGPGGLTLTFQSCANVTVAVERSGDLKEWTEIGTVLATSPVSTFTDGQGTGTRFYRLRQNL